MTKEPTTKTINGFKISSSYKHNLNDSKEIVGNISKTKKPTLSDKRISSMDGWDEVNQEEIKSFHYPEEDVKDFIKNVLKFIEYNDDGYADYIELRAGDKLIK